jgi:Peptidase family M1 domain
MSGRFPGRSHLAGVVVAMFAAFAVLAPGALAHAPLPVAALFDDEEVCSSGAHTLSHLGDRVYPEMGNGGYESIHTDVNLVYDAIENEFLDGNHVVLTQLSTQCLSDFSLDFAAQTPDNEEGPGADMQVQKVFVNGEEAAFQFVQPTYPGDPNGQDDPDPAAHQTGLDTPVSPTNPLPPACTPESPSPAASGQPCPARKLVITPTAPIPAGEEFEVKVAYVGHPGVYTDAGEEAEGWFRSNSPAGDGAFVTTEPVGTAAWMPLNNHPSAKPTYDFNEKVTKDRTVIANGELVRPESGELAEDNPPDEQFLEGSTTWRWHSPEPIANYLVENSVGNYDLTERVGPDGIIYFQAQGSSLTATRKAQNKAIMDQQEDITHFQERFNGPYPFTTDGVVIGVPNASFEEEMQGKITFNGGQIGLTTFNHENMHQWWGDNVSESSFNETFFKEGFARLSEFLQAARTAAVNAGGLDTPAGDAAFEASLVARFRTNYLTNGTMWTRAPSNPLATTLFSTPTTYTRPATAYIALRRIIGKDNFVSALKQIQREFAGSSIEERQLEDIFTDWMPNQSPACRSRLNQFFTEWFDTEFAASGSATALRPQLTGPGLEPSASGLTFFNADGTCNRVAPAPPVTTAAVVPTPAADGKVIGPATVTLTASDPASGIARTEFKLDNSQAFTVYSGPIRVAAVGAHTVQFRSLNRDGALEATKTVTFTVVPHDPPVTSATISPSPVDGNVVGPATVTLSATENGGGVQSTEFKVDGGPFQPYNGPFVVSSFGAHTVEFRSTNRDGVVEATKQVSFTVVPHDPPVTSASITRAADGRGPATVTLSATENGGGVQSTEYSLDGEGFQPYDGPFTVSSFGDHTVEFRSTNRDGVVEETRVVTFTVVPHDAPVTSATVSFRDDGDIGPATVTLSATENGGGIASTEYSVDGEPFQLYDGPFVVSGFAAHIVEFRSTNRDGVVEVPKQIAFTVIPHLPPTTTASVLPEPVDGRVVGPATVVLETRDNGGGVVSTEFKVDGGEFQPYDGPIDVSGFGPHTVEYRSTNGDGVVEETQRTRFTVVPHDAPVTSATVSPNPVGGNVVGPATVTLSTAENGGGVASTEVKVDGGPFQPYNGPFVVAGFAAHTVEYRSTNRDGVVEGTRQTRFTVVAHAAPTTTASVLPKSADGKVTGSATVVLEAKDNGGGIAATQFSLDGGAFQAYMGPIVVSTLGNHTVGYRSTNGDGVAEATKNVGFSIVAPPTPPTPPAAPPLCADPRLSIAVSHPLVRGKDGVGLRRGKAYRYTGRLTCGSAGTPAPEGTVIAVSSLVGGRTTRQPGIAVGANGKIDTLLQFSSNRTVVFRFSADGASAEDRIHITFAPKRERPKTED